MLTMLTLQTDLISTYLPDLVPPVLTCFEDSHHRTRYYACEALYNVAKASRGHIMEFFSRIFNSLSQVHVSALVSCFCCLFEED